MFELSNGSPIPDSCDDTPPAGCQDLHECDKPRNERQAKWIADVIELVGAVLGVLGWTYPKH